MASDTPALAGLYRGSRTSSPMQGTSAAAASALTAPQGPGTLPAAPRRVSALLEVFLQLTKIAPSH